MIDPTVDVPVDVPVDVAFKYIFVVNMVAQTWLHPNVSTTDEFKFNTPHCLIVVQPRTLLSDDGTEGLMRPRGVQINTSQKPIYNQSLK